MNVATATGLEPMSPFEEAVIEKLQLHGYIVEPQVGSAGFFIDIGVRDPDNPARFVLGIECDGAQYHSSRTARDRDKLRHMVLEDRGWRIHRIWSTDWWSHPERELRRCFEAIEQAKVGAHIRAEVLAQAAVVDIPVSLSPNEELSEAMAKPNGPQSVEYKFATVAVPEGIEIHEISQYTMADLVSNVVAIESPIHIDEVVRRIREAGGKGRAGERMRLAVERGMRAAQSKGVIFDGAFLFKKEAPVALRSRSNWPPQYKKLDYVSDMELELAILQVVASAFEISSDEVAAISSKVLGFDRATAQMRARICSVIEEMCGRGKLLKDARGLKLP